MTAVGCNCKNNLIVVKHSELERVSDLSVFRSKCPVCKDGVLLVTRVPNTLRLSEYDNCLYCGQVYRYEDIEELSKLVGEPLVAPKERYRIDPEKYGFVHVSKVPELDGILGSTTYVKFIAGSESVKWYSAFRAMGRGDDRYQVYSGVYDYRNPSDEANFHAQTVYLGLISNETFAEDLFSHLLGTLSNDSVYTLGKERLFNLIGN